MGVPKFFRYLSQRYPSLSQLVKPFEIPEIDNLYLDMNGIIHVCSHPNDFDPLFRITEEQIFSAIFHYIEFIFQTIQPQKLFFMAVDGVAPRAKMNQQRGRRFKSVKEAELLERLAKEQGKQLPSEARFDSNCITPGTVFMDRLQKQLEYFVANKLSTDPKWQQCTIILSGHETPGEGEHKIMDYIRYMKSQPDYDPNIRHCLYGLDADLITLGLCTHDPQFCLLREEIKYNKKANKRISTPEETNFFLLHLSMLREYLNLEFQSLAPSLPFPYDLERIIDDWVLMGFLVGNDFIPHLPDLHINKGAFNVIYEAYRQVLPKLDGYINEDGFLNVARFQKFMAIVAEFDLENFESLFSDLSYFNEKTGQEESSAPVGNKDLQRLIAATNDLFDSGEEEDEMDKDTMIAEFLQHKTNYYESKMDYSSVTEEVLKSQAEGYVRAIQWNLHYYYHGCKSWSWFYPHHYSPFASDVSNFVGLNLDFDMGKPFLPFHQLLAVLPPASKELLPEAYRGLMTNKDSPIIDFYPDDFDTDLNGKQQEWEAVVLIPFINEDRLLGAMEPCNEHLNGDERRRNTHGPMLVCNYSKDNLGIYKSPGHFPDINENHAKIQGVWPKDIEVDMDRLQFGLRPGYRRDVYCPGFPTLRFKEYTSTLENANVKVFDHGSKQPSIIIALLEQDPPDAEKVAKELLGKTIYVSWPHLVEARVNAVADENRRFYLTDGCLTKKELKGRPTAAFKNEAKNLQDYHYERRGIKVGETSLLVYAYVMEGRRYLVNKDGSIKRQIQWSPLEAPYTFQTVVKSIEEVRPRKEAEIKTVSDLFPPESMVFILAPPHYGSMCTVLPSPPNLKEGCLKVAVEVVSDPQVDVKQLLQEEDDAQYMPCFQAARSISMSSQLFARVTGSIFLASTGGGKSKNIGLSLKYTKKNEEVPGYTKRDGGAWLYSHKTANLVADYANKFPELFDFLNSRQDGVDRDVDLSDLYGPDKCADKVREIVEWLSEQEAVQLTPVECGAEIISNATVEEIQKAVVMSPIKSSTFNLEVNASHLFKSEMTEGNVAPTIVKHQLLDRVVCCRAGRVPIGTRGYIIGIHKGSTISDSMYDILFDVHVNTGKGKSARVPACTFINISAGDRNFTKLPINLNAPIVLRPPGTTLQPSAFAPVVQTPSPQPSENESRSNQVKPKPNSSNIAPLMQILTSQPSEKESRTNQAKPKPNISNFAPMAQTESSQPSEKNWRTNALPKPNTSISSNVNSVIEDSKKAEALLKALKVTPGSNEKEKSPGSHVSPCSTLLSHFQRSGLGTPKYQAHNQGGGIMAQVTLPNGAVYWSVPCPTKEAAYENGALQALASLGLRSNFSNAIIDAKEQLKVQLKKQMQQPLQHQKQQLPQQPQQLPQQQQQQPPKPQQYSQNHFIPQQMHHMQHAPNVYHSNNFNGGQNMRNQYPIMAHQPPNFMYPHRPPHNHNMGPPNLIPPQAFTAPTHQYSQTFSNPMNDFFPSFQSMNAQALPLPPTNWQTKTPNNVPTVPAPASSKIPSSFIPLQAITGAPVTKSRGRLGLKPESSSQQTADFFATKNKNNKPSGEKPSARLIQSFIKSAINQDRPLHRSISTPSGSSVIEERNPDVTSTCNEERSVSKDPNSDGNEALTPVANKEEVAHPKTESKDQAKPVRRRIVANFNTPN